MTRSYLADEALLPDGWAKQVLIEVNATGIITQVRVGAPADTEIAAAERIVGPILPGMPNLHSHAFQRAMAGTTQRSGPAGDSFWSWREQMYRFLDVLGPEDVEAIATMLFVEMLEAGYTSVAEFHYLHHAPNGSPYSDSTEMGQRIVSAAQSTGIGLTLLPVMYQYGGFNQRVSSQAQRRFVHRADSFVLMVERLKRGLPSHMQLGVAPHSLRAVDPHDLLDLRKQLSHLGPDTPWHIHAAEQTQEVAECIDATGRRPIEWLLDNVPLDHHWCVVHATHMTNQETISLAASGAVAGVCPSTEADLGDGFFDAERFFAANGAFGLGGDSHVGIDPWAELRLFEYGQRLLRQRRNLLGGEPGQSVGGTLYRRALAGGARALAQPVGALAVGASADWLVLDTQGPNLYHRHGDDLLDAAIFGPAANCVKRVMVRGQWRVEEGIHPARADAERGYRQVIERLVTAA